MIYYNDSLNNWDERNYLSKHVEVIEIINKPLLLHLLVCLFYCNKTVTQLDYLLRDSQTFSTCKYEHSSLLHYS